MLAERHVRRLIVRSQESVAIPRITTLLGDAIRTASLPNLPVNGIVCIRRIDLGRISTSTHSHFLSRRLDQLIRNLSFFHITSESLEQDDAAAVWFADSIEPYRLLSELIAQGKSSQAWYWSIAVPHWLPSMSASESVLLFLSQLTQKQTGITGISYALEPFVKRGTMFAVLNKIKTRQLKAVIKDLFLPRVPIINSRIVNHTVTEEITAPDKITDDRLPEQWKKFLGQSFQHWEPDDVRLRLAIGLSLQKAGMIPGKKNVMELVRAILRHETPITRNRENLTPTTRKVIIDYPSLTDESIPKQQHRSAPSPVRQPLTAHYSGELSEYGGFLFLLPVIQRLGMTKLLENTSDETDQQLIQRVLLRVATWLRIPADDPVLRFLGQPLIDQPRSLEFIAPKRWQTILRHGPQARLRLVRILHQPGKRLILDPVSRLILGAWQLDNTEQIREWLDSYPLQSQIALPRAWTLDDLVNNVVIAMCRYVRYYAQMNIHTLVKHPAYIACTHTHMDWSASLARLDNRVRMAGLDIDPGWVPSLQYVFYFHYVDDET